MGPFAGRAGDARSSGQLLKLPEAKERILVPAIQSYFIEPIWEQFRVLLPEREVDHPLGCHRSRISDREVFEKLHGTKMGHVADVVILTPYNLTSMPALRSRCGG